MSWASVSGWACPRQNWVLGPGRHIQGVNVILRTEQRITCSPEKGVSWLGATLVSRVVERKSRLVTQTLEEGVCSFSMASRLIGSHHRPWRRLYAPAAWPAGSRAIIAEHMGKWLLMWMIKKSIYIVSLRPIKQKPINQERSLINNKYAGRIECSVQSIAYLIFLQMSTLIISCS